MKLKFKHQSFQVDAANSVVRAFEGQQYSCGVDYATDDRLRAGLFSGEFCNAPLTVSKAEITENIRKIQTEQNLKPIEHLQGEGINLTIEMETGTGKTYTYIKTMYELNKRYGWSKFVIVVPSVAIREGVCKSFETMQDHFAYEYGKRIQHFVYNSKQLTKIDNFAGDDSLHVMIINMQAFNTSLNEEKNQEGRKGDSSARIIFSKRDEFGSRRPIDVLAKTNPIMIVDEPQSVLGVNANSSTRKGIEKFNPLFKLLYSATHREVMNMVYRLDAIDAYNKKLVKKIEVKGIYQVGTTATSGYVSLDEILISKGNPKALITFDYISSKGDIKRVTKTVGEGFDLYENSGQLEEYKDNYIVQIIDGRTNTVSFLNGLVVSVGEVEEDVMRRQQIRETIITHIDREKQLFHKGIKVLSLFFIDHVSNYRTYDDDGDGKGKYAQIFEEEYKDIVAKERESISNDEYLNYVDKFSAEQVHNGYFSRDKKGNLVDPKIGRGETNSNDEGAYELIMKDKERLLSFEEPTRFIFSHSALKEGWDNPNVFQICTLKNSANETNKRQEVGRGMRICVNKDGERQDVDVLGENGVFDVNVLTVIASESYEQFSKQLQQEIADAVADRPTKVNKGLFLGQYYTVDGVKSIIDDEKANEIHYQMRFGGYIDKKGNLTEKYHKEKNELSFDEDIAPMKDDIVRILENVFNPQSIRIDNARKIKTAKFQESRFRASKEFQEMWNIINQKTYYQVDFKTDDLVGNAVELINNGLTVTAFRLVVKEGEMNHIKNKEALKAGTAMEITKVKNVDVNEGLSNGLKYDLIGRLVEITGLTRATIVKILKNISADKFALFKSNPEEFIRKVGGIINDAKAVSVVQGISYNHTDKKYETDIFTVSELKGEIGKNAIESNKSLYDIVVVDSEGVEKKFAEGLETAEDILVYTKLPRGFYINTPMGNYNPDWALVYDSGEKKHIYFVAETKGSLQATQLRTSEQCKINCARKHFSLISKIKKVGYYEVDSVKTLYDKLNELKKNI